MIAQEQDSTTWSTGLWIVEDVQGLVSSIESGSWVDATIGGIGTGLDALSIAMDPLGSLASMAVGWLMEHVEPLREALDELTGDADEVNAHAQTWTNIANGLGTAAVDLQSAVAVDMPSWQGDAARSYAANAELLVNGVGGLSGAATAMSAATTSAGQIVAAVREIVRDLIADCVATLLVRIPEWLAEVGLTLGVGASWVIPKAVNLIAKWVGRIMDFLDALTLSMQALQLLLG